MNMRILLLFLLLPCLAAFATVSTIINRPDGMWLVFSNTPPNWTLEQTGDLYTWHHVLSGSTTSSIVECRIKSGMEAIFFRIK
jgi:hypothetical protein